MKRYISILLLLSFVAIGLFTFTPQSAFACSCAVKNAQERLDDSAAVFVGKVIHKGLPGLFRSGETREYVFDVQRAWKGVSTKRITIQALGGGSESCGISFSKNQSYIVFAHYDDKRILQTNLCSGNVKASADESVAILGTASMEADALSGGAYGGTLPSLNLFLYISAFVLVVAASIMAWKAYRRKRQFR
ncbi:hypothetical protein OMP38_11645 [Cohnella ginsengisoli]|uniref:Tissue inhibitor of metalloproteinase n=1 Tax=Cohnella ginsengisoli TaxID=425004 RepID=A0A9X4KGR1_9BACL|nr:hypothetical protein [Cohnella ginsengisoli]MDG0791446.1 hypothetical protein [Cohnella ginsengisoli]